MATPDQGANSTPEHVLIVEDNELNLRLLKDILGIHGYDVVGTGWGSTAVKLARQCRPAVILLDIQLPDISGLEAARPQGSPGRFVETVGHLGVSANLIEAPPWG